MTTNRFIDLVFVSALLVLGPAVFVTLVGPWIDKRYPVVDPFVVVSNARVGDHMIMSGWLYKARACDPTAIYAVVYMPKSLPRIVDIEFLERLEPRGHLVSRPEGAQLWGPWRAAVPEGAERVDLHTAHRCHPFWTTTATHALWRKSEET